MSKIKLSSKIIPFVLIISFLFTSCDVPDISKFTEQSAEMTRGIRKGVKGTEKLIQTASERSDLYDEETIEGLSLSLIKYKKSLAPTLATLDALDGYLEALNALAQANKKSEENSRAVVNSVTNLVTAVSGIQLAETAVNLATGLFTLAEQFRTAKDFQKRVNLAAIIVEGRHSEITNAETGNVTIIKPCKKDELDRILKTPDITKPEKEKRVARLGCGVIDLLKFNIEDLKVINDAVSDDLFVSLTQKNQVVLDYYSAINSNDTRVMSELENILRYRDLTATITEAAFFSDSSDTIKDLKITLKNTLDSIFITDLTLKTSITGKVNTCGAACGRLAELLALSVTTEGCNVRCGGNAKCLARQTKCRAKRDQIITSITPSQFDTGNSIVMTELEKRESELLTRNKANIADLQRITPNYSAVAAELKTIRENQNQLNEVLDSSMSALDTWAETHANLRTAVNSKQALNVAKLASKVREIWEIIDPKSSK